MFQLIRKAKKNVILTVISFVLSIIFFKLTLAKTILNSNPNFTYFTIAAGPASGTYFPFASLLASTLTNPPGSPPCSRGGSCGVPDLIAIAYATEGSLHNLELLNEGKVDSALVQSDLLLKEKRPYRLIATLYPELLHIVVLKNSSIQKVADLKGKVISIGKTNSGSAQSIKEILRILNLNEKNLTIRDDDPGKACDLLQTSKIDAFLIIAGHPVPCIDILAKNNALRLINLLPQEEKKIVSKNKAFAPYHLEQGAYWNIPEIHTIRVFAQWITLEKTSEDLVYQLTKALWHSQNQMILERHFSRMNFLLPLDSVRAKTIPFHKGAYKFYKEKKLVED